MRENLLTKVEVQNALGNISKKISRIEDRDDNFNENKSWIKLREQMEILYNRLKEIN